MRMARRKASQAGNVKEHMSQQLQAYILLEGSNRRLCNLAVWNLMLGMCRYEWSLHLIYHISRLLLLLTVAPCSWNLLS